MVTKELTLRRAELRQAKKEAGHRQRIDYLDRLIGITVPVITNPVVLFLGGWSFINYSAGKAQAEIDKPGGPGFFATMGLGIDTAALKTAMTAAFVANAFGGPTGITKIVQALK